MPYNTDIHHRRSIRLHRFDYTSHVPYFVTICSLQRQLSFDDSAVANILSGAWRWLLRLDGPPEPYEFVVMPNHVHGLVWLPRRGVGAQREELIDPAAGSLGLPSQSEACHEEAAAPLRSRVRVSSGSLGAFVRSFKSMTTRRVNVMRGTPGFPLWQRNYYERVVRSERELQRVWQYIEDNPAKWDADKNNPANWPVADVA